MIDIIGLETITIEFVEECKTRMMRWYIFCYSSKLKVPMFEVNIKTNYKGQSKV